MLAFKIGFVYFSRMCKFSSYDIVWLMSQSVNGFNSAVFNYNIFNLKVNLWKSSVTEASKKEQFSHDTTNRLWRSQMQMSYLSMATRRTNWPCVVFIYCSSRVDLSEKNCCCCFILGQGNPTALDWQWLHNFGTALRSAEALTRRLSFPSSFLSSGRDCEGNEAGKCPKVT